MKIGGVLFAIEVTSSFYNMQHLWKSFYCAMCIQSFQKKKKTKQKTKKTSKIKIKLNKINLLK